MELLWYCIREMDADALERALRMMDGERRRRVAELPNEDDRKRSAAGELLARQAAAKAGRQSWVLELPRHRCYTETIRGYPPEKALKIKEKAL